MSILRASVRLCAIAAVTLVLFSLWLAGRIFSSADSLRGVAARRRSMHRWAKAVVRILGARVEVEGTVPAAPCVLVSNHLGYVDIPIFASCADLVFVSKVEVRSWPVIGRAAAAVGTIFLDRDSRRAIPEVNRQIRAALEARDRVLFFPEGTSTDGKGVLPFRSSLLEPAAQSGYPVFCASVHYSTPAGESPASHAVCWWGETGFASHLLRLTRLSRFRARIVFHGEPQTDADRKLLKERTERVVRKLHGQLTAD